MRLRHGLAAEAARDNIYAAEQTWLASSGLREPEVSHSFDVWIGDIDERLCGGSSVCAGHIRHAIMDDLFLDEGRMMMRSRAGCFGATTLIDRNVHKYAAGFHTPQHFTREQLWRPGPGHQHGPYEQINIGQNLNKTRLARIERVRGLHGNVQKPHPLEVHFENRHVCSEPRRHPGGVHPARPSAQNDDPPWEHARDAAEQHAFSPVVLGEEISAHQDGHPAGDLAHRFKERQASVHLNRFIRDAGCARRSEALGKSSVRS
jgi:hypothetical protein